MVDALRQTFLCFQNRWLGCIKVLGVPTVADRVWLEHDALPTIGAVNVAGTRSITDHQTR
jgi:hypothetical protein